MFKMSAFGRNTGRQMTPPSTRQWRGSQQANNDTFITSLATLSLSNK